MVVDLKNPDSRVKIAKRLILFGILYGVVNSFSLILTGSMAISWGLDKLFYGWVLVLGIINTIGIIIEIIAYRMIAKKNFKKAGILAIISSFILPLNVLTLIGGILCIVIDKLNS